MQMSWRREFHVDKLVGFNPLNDDSSNCRGFFIPISRRKNNKKQIPTKHSQMIKDKIIDLIVIVNGRNFAPPDFYETL